MKKKIIPAVLISILTLTSTTLAFSDMNGHWATASVEELNKSNIVKGYEDDTFRPDNFMTRAEVVTVINRLIGASKESSKYIPDINRQDWYYAEIRKAVQSGTMYGDTDGYTRPNDYITREEVVVMLSRAFSISSNANLNSKYVDEKEISDWAQNSVCTFINFEYLTGYEDNTIRPKSNITRAEFVTILDRIFEIIAINGMYTDTVNGNVLVLGDNIVLSDLKINGNLIVAEGTAKTLQIDEVEVRGDLVLREEIDISDIIVYDEKVYLYEQLSDNLNQYVNEEYGIEFSISDKVKVYENWREENVDYDRDDILLIDIEQSDEYYLKSMEKIGKLKSREFDVIYDISEQGVIGNAFYILYDDVSNEEKYKLLVIKRDNTVYTLLFINVTEENLVDNVLATLELIDGEKIVDRKIVIYKNSKLNLKFNYREGYVGIDDSYNTSQVYSGDAPLKLFIQVNTITDMQDYSFDEVQYLLKTLAKEDGNLLKTETLKVVNNNAVKFKILTSENKIMYSLYIIIGNNLYDLIFTAEEEVMNEVGDYFFEEIIKSLEI